MLNGLENGDGEGEGSSPVENGDANVLVLCNGGGPGAEAMLPEIKPAILFGGRGISLGSCGPTGTVNIIGQARNTSKSGTEARPLFRALSKTAAGMLTG